MNREQLFKTPLKDLPTINQMKMIAGIIRSNKPRTEEILERTVEEVLDPRIECDYGSISATVLSEMVAFLADMMRKYHMENIPTDIDDILIRELVSDKETTNLLISVQIYTVKELKEFDPLAILSINRFSKRRFNILKRQLQDVGITYPTPVKVTNKKSSKRRTAAAGHAVRYLKSPDIFGTFLNIKAILC